MLKLKNGRDDERIACVMRNARDFIEHLKIKRALTNAKSKVRVGADGGGEWLKFTTNLMNEEEQPPTTASRDLFEEDFKDTGIKQLTSLSPDSQSNPNLSPN